MANFQFQQAGLELTYAAGQDENGNTILKKSSLRYIREAATADQLNTVAQAVASLSGYSFMEAVKTQKQYIL